MRMLAAVFAVVVAVAVKRKQLSISVNLLALPFERQGQFFLPTGG